MSKWHHVWLFCCALALISTLGIISIYAGGARLHAEVEQPAPARQAPAHPAFVGSETCAGCHADLPAQLQQHFHGAAMAALEKNGKGRLCEGCHGPGELHANDPSARTAKPLLTTAKAGTTCLECHGNRLSSVKWRQSDHHRSGIGCLQCHAQPVAVTGVTPAKGKPANRNIKALAIQPHADLNRVPGTGTCLTCHGNKRGELSLPSHHPVKEGRVGCTDCHDPHRPQSKEMKREVCVSCHAAQRGPFRFEHGAISGHLTDACLDCHRPHGSPNQRLLKIANRGLCLQCHADKVRHFNGTNCWDCHQAVHGSNSEPALFRK